MITLGKNQAIYNPDSRRFVSNTEDDMTYTKEEYMQLARSICLLVPKSKIVELWATREGSPVPYPAGGFDLVLFGKIQDYILQNLNPSGSGAYTVSKNIKFYNDLVVGSEEIGTGVMIGDRQILTVDHLFENIDPSGYVAIFNWTETPVSPYNRLNFDPYYCFRITGYEKFAGKTLKQIKLAGKTDKMDLSIIKTDRIMDKTHGNIPPLNIYNSTNVKEKLIGKELFMIGHCMGLPQVLTDDAFINTDITFAKAISMGITNLVDPNKPLTQNQFDRLCFVNLDGFAGNSGSPIFIKDKKYGWNVVGIYTGGADDYKSNSTGVIEEWIYSKKDYEQLKVFEHFQILEGFPNFKKYCDTDCDYIDIQERSIKNPLIKGEWIDLKMPRLSTLNSGQYLVQFTSSVAVKVRYINGIPIPATVRGFVADGQNYDINMINLKTQEIVYNFNKSGKARGDQIKSGNVFNVSASTNGLLTDRLNFVPNIKIGEPPLIVNFNPYIPNAESAISCHWDFGDGETSDFMYPCHTYIFPYVYTVKLTVQYQNHSDYFTYNDCIEVVKVLQHY